MTTLKKFKELKKLKVGDVLLVERTGEGFFLLHDDGDIDGNEAGAIGLIEMIKEEYGLITFQTDYDLEQSTSSYYNHLTILENLGKI
jgi:hypothetical protein